MSGERFTVRVNVEIQRDPRGGYSGDRLTTAEEFHIPATGFTEIAGVLGRFHELAETVSAEHRERFPMAEGCREWRASMRAEKCNSGACERCHG